MTEVSHETTSVESPHAWTGWIRTPLLAAIALSGVIFASLLLAASVSAIGWKFFDACKYLGAVLLPWLVLETFDRFLGDRYRKCEPWVMMAFFLVVYMIVIQLAPELGQRRMPYDSLRAQKSLEAGRIAFFRPLKFYTWINYDAVLSLMGMIFKPKLAVGQALNALCRVLVLFPVFRLGERISGRRMARFVTVALAMSPALTLYATTLVGDFMAGMFYLYGFYILVTVPDWQCYSPRNVLAWVAIGVLAGCGFLFKTLSFLFWGAILVWFVVRALEARKLKTVLLLGVAFATMWFGYKTVITVRESVFTRAINPRELAQLRYEGSLDVLLYEMYLGLCIETGGSYNPSRDRAIRSVGTPEKIQLVKKMLVDGKSRYPDYLVYKFKRVWGTNDSPGSILFWFWKSCQENCYNSKAKNYCVPWLQPLLGAEHLFLVALFLAGMCGLAWSLWERRASLGDAQGVGLMSIVVVLAYAALSMLIEAHGRYRTTIYPFFYLVIPFAGVWFKKCNPLYVRIVVRVRRWPVVAKLQRQETGQPCCAVSAAPSEPSGASGTPGHVARCVVGNWDKICPVLAWCASGIVLFFVAVAVTSTIIYIRQDYPLHIKVASGITFKALCHPLTFLQTHYCYPVWHILTWLSMKVLGCSGRSAAIGVSAGCFVATWAYAAVYFSKKYSPKDDLVRAACFCLILVSPIWLPFFNPNLMMGQSSPNLLHSPTNLMVRAVAFPCFIWYAAIMDGIGKKTGFRLSSWKFAALSLLVLLSSLSKPSFVQVFLPAIFILAVLKVVQYRKAAIVPVLIVGASVIPVVLLMALQAWVAFYAPHTGGGGPPAGISVAFLKIWSPGTPSVTVSILLAIFFPLIVLLWSLAARKVSTSDVLAWIMWGVGVVEAAFLFERGRRMWHANFFWGYSLALFFLWFVALDRFISLTKEHVSGAVGSKYKWWFFVAVPALLLHVVSGVCYLWRVLVYCNWR